jgi:CO/xanthine dehydrogenase FAD-binding subunit
VPTLDNIAAASAMAADGLECIADLHGSPDYRQNLCRVLTRRALAQAVERARE